jgi:hypothetical protein
MKTSFISTPTVTPDFYKTESITSRQYQHQSEETYSNVDLTVFDNDGTKGACGYTQYNSDMIVALALPAWGPSTYDRMTGSATNPWCGRKINIVYENASINATITDLCPKCDGHDIDLSVAAWNKLTGSKSKGRLKGSWRLLISAIESK